MTTEQHTPEPWVLHGLHINVGDCYIVAKGAGAAEHMRRIVACVNACAGMPLEMLELGAIGEASRTRIQLYEQRDDLAEALRTLLDRIDYITGDDGPEIYKRCQAALARLS